MVREAWSTMWAAKVSSSLVLLLVATMCAASVATVGQTAAAEAQLLERLDSAGSRVLVITDSRGEDLVNATIVDHAAGLTTTERAVGVSMPRDVVNGVVGRGAPRVPAWGVYGDLTAVATLAQGRWPGPGEALVSIEAMDRLGLDEPVGWVALASTTTVDDLSVVGSFVPREPFGDFAAGVLYPADAEPLDTMHVVFASAGQAGVAQDVILRLIAAPSPDALTVSSPLSLAALQEQVAGDLAGFGRTLLLAVLGGGAVLVATITLADVLVRRQDLGRRRALGATRTTILIMVVLRTMFAALMGAVLGGMVGVGITSWLNAIPPWDFTVGTAVLALVVAGLATIPPAFYAATRDPVRVLRTP